MKLLVAIPTLDYIHYDFVTSLLALTKKLTSDGVDFDVKMQGDTLVYAGRSELAKAAMYGGYSHTLWLDADMVFEPDIFDKLYMTERAFITGICHSRRPPYRPCIYKSLVPPKRYESVKEYPTEVFKIGGCGFACVLIETRILQDVKKRNFYPFFPTPDLGEDLAFCKRATDLGYEIWAHPDVRLGHISKTTIYPNDY